jgi:hypothetical protein
MDSIVQASVHDSSTQWTELITRLKQSLLLVFEFKINEMEESLRTMVSTRSRQGWDFQSFFIQKVGSIAHLVVTSVFFFFEKKSNFCRATIFRPS